MTKGEGKRKKIFLLVVHRRFFILIYQLKVTKIAGYPAGRISGKISIRCIPNKYVIYFFEVEWSQ